MNVYQYIAESNPHFAKGILHKYGYHATNIRTNKDLGECLKKLVSVEGEGAFNEIMDKHPDKEVIMEMYAPKKEVYSNAGFAVAGHIAEKVMGKEYEYLIEEYLFSPLNMKSAGWGAPGTWRSSGNNLLDEPWGHEKNGSPVKPLTNTSDGKGSDNPVAIAPAGRLHCTIKDWGCCRFI